MKKTIRSVLVSVCVVAVVLGGITVRAEAFGFGEGKSGGMHEKKGEKMDELMQEIGLTAEQQEKIRALKGEHKEKGEEVMSQLKTKKIELRDELNKPESDNARIQKIVNEAADLYKKKTELNVESVLGMKKVLTPEQFELLNEKMEIRKEVRKQLMKQKGHSGGEGHRRNSR